MRHCARRYAYWFVLASLLFAFLLIGVTHLGGFCWDFDEGVILEKAWLAQRYRLYREIWSDHMPGYFLCLALAFRLFGVSVETGRALTLCFATLGLVGVAMAVRELGSRLGSLIAVASLALSPLFFRLSRAAMMGLPAVCLASLAFPPALRYLRTGKRGWLILAGAFYALGISMKLVAAPFILPLAFAVFLRGKLWREKTKDLAALASPVAALFLLLVLLFQPEAMAAQILGNYLGDRGSSPLDLAANGWRAAGLLAQCGLMAAPLCGLASCVIERRRDMFLVLAWFGASLAALLTHTPLFDHHMLLLLPPAASLMGGALGEIERQLRSLLSMERARPPGILTALVFGLAVGSVVVFLCQVPQMIARDQGLTVAVKPEAPCPFGWEAARLVREVTRPGDFVITDYPMIAFRAGRMVPPWICVPSYTRVHNGFLTAEELISASLEYRPRAVVLWGRAFELLPRYVSWVEANYDLLATYDEEHRIYVHGMPGGQERRAMGGD